MEVTLSGLIVILGQVILFVGFIWKRSGVESEQRGKIENAQHDIVRLEGEFDTKIATLGASITLMRDQHHELREHLATNYMKREEIAAMERRVVDNQTAILARIDKFETRIDTLQRTLLDAIAGLRAERRA
jgi:uncharacterized protein Yka (UPF0111/DUF47 family)